MEDNSAPNKEVNKENGTESNNNHVSRVDNKNDNDPPGKPISNPKKELPVEKKPFQEFINIHLIPALVEEINQRGLGINYINLKNTNRPIAGDKCWVINCEIKETCSFWLSFEKEDISSLKVFLYPNQIKNLASSNHFLLTKKE